MIDRDDWNLAGGRGADQIVVANPRQIPDKIYTVSNLTRDIRAILEENFSGIWVEGEISNFKFHSSGHMYFSLKDETAQVQCVMFRRENQALDFEPKEGLAILGYGRVSVYPVRGQYQFYVERMEPKGIGALGLKFQALKEKLRREGLFEEARKREIPFLPERIGILTSLDGAALRDILHVLNRRFSNAHLLIYPVPVQGEGAAPAIAEAIEDMNRWRGAEVLILARGGGSLEDLWAFNEEIVARAIFGSRIPVVSAVGHETDFTIADFVADLRAPTPSAAAEIVMPLEEELVSRLAGFRSRAIAALTAKIKFFRRELAPLRASRVLKDPLGLFEIQAQRMDELRKNMASLVGNLILFKKEKVAALIGKLGALGPLATLKRGFSVTMKLPEERVVHSVESLKLGDRIKTRLYRGFVMSEVREINA